MTRRVIVACVVACVLAGAAAAAAAPQATRTTHVTVTAREFKFALSKRSVPTGTVVFTVVNKGKVAHDFKIAGRKTPLIKPGKRATVKVVFHKRGKYRYLCTVPGHAAAGMKGTLTV
jgi:uncharacterized cupredoxin-like copper-binding protein